MLADQKDFTDYYSILGVQKNATQKNIQKAFWDLSRKYHPDLNKSPLAAAHYKLIVDAYQSLKSQDDRDDLDAQIISSFCKHLSGDILGKRTYQNATSMDIVSVLMDLLVLEEVTSVKKIHALNYPEDVSYRQLLFVGPPGVGKSKLTAHLHAWPEEGNLDLSQINWWRSPVLDVRPRELHLLFPFAGYKEGMAVFDEPITNTIEDCFVDFSRIVLPPKKKGLFSVDWRKRNVFEFIMPDPQKVFEWRLARAHRGTHAVDFNLTFDVVQKQCAFFEQVAKYLHIEGLRVLVRKSWDQPPLQYVLPESEAKIS